MVYRLSVGVVLYNSYGDVFIGKRRGLQILPWSMVQGGVEDGESFYDASFRELKEEVGLEKSCVACVSESKDLLRYDFPKDLKGGDVVSRYSGQEFKWFLFKFTGSNDDINIFSDNKEFCDWRWCNPKILMNFVVHFKQFVYHSVIDEFYPRILTDISEL